MKFTILVIDDEENIRNGLECNFELEDYNVKTASNGKEGLDLLSKGDIDLVITDLRMDGISGEEVLRQVSTTMPGIPVIVLTGHGSIDSAVEAMRNGAYDFLTKPLNLDELNVIVKRALETRELKYKHSLLKEELETINNFGKMVGKSTKMRKLYDTISKISPSRASVLITGESGCGKELVAEAIHNNSPRKDKPLIKVHCASLSDTLMESELFGHEKGAFTGADGLKKGRFELAHGGTLFLDEIGEIDQNTQVKLLRVLQERKFERVGGEETIEVDVRVIAATNRNLEEEVKAGRFREDLFYRLNVVHLEVPPLRERKNDIPLLINTFINKFNKENGKSIKGLQSACKSCLLNYSWPGNVRQLQNTIESAVVLASSHLISLNDIPETIRGEYKPEKNISLPVGTTLEDAETEFIIATLVYFNGNKSKTADALAIDRKTLKRKLQGMDLPEFENEEE